MTIDQHGLAGIVRDMLDGNGHALATSDQQEIAACIGVAVSVNGGFRLAVSNKVADGQPEEIRTTKHYWDCECERDYIHPKSEPTCVGCGARPEDQPDSIIAEVVAACLPLSDPRDFGYIPMAGSLKHKVFTNNAGLTLQVRENATASLWAMVGVVELEVKAFQWPHPRFQMLEKQLLVALKATEGASHGQG
jgi:hypothetical protein